MQQSSQKEERLASPGPPPWEHLVSGPTPTGPSLTPKVPKNKAIVWATSSQGWQKGSGRCQSDGG